MKTIPELEAQYSQLLSISLCDLRVKYDHDLNKKKYAFYFLMSKHISIRTMAKRYGFANSVVSRAIRAFKSRYHKNDDYKAYFNSIGIELN